MLNIRDLAWLAGLLEGEGSFMYRSGDSACVSVQMTDRDVVERVAKLLGSNLNGPYVRKDGHKTTCACRVHGAKAIGLMMTLYSLLGDRRKEQIEKALISWKHYKRPPRPKGFAGIPYKKEKQEASCHPGKRVVGWGLCGACYMREWRASRRAEMLADGANGVLTIA